MKTNHVICIACFLLLAAPMLCAQEADVAAQVELAFADASKEYEIAMRKWQSLHDSLAEIRSQIPALQSGATDIQERKPTLPVFDERIWKTLDKKFTTRATLIDTDGTTVRLKKTDGKTVSIEKRILIASDRIYADKCHEELTEAKRSLVDWKKEYDTFVLKLDDAMNKAKAATLPKPTAPNKDEIATRIERTKRGIEAKPVPDSPGVFSARLTIGSIEVRLPSPIIWLPKGSKKYDGGGFCRVKLLVGSEGIYEDHGVLNASGKPVIVAKAPGTEHFEVEKSAKLGAWYTFKSPGETYVSLKIGDESVWVPFEIKELPYPTGTASTQILKELGFPTSKDTHYTSWPDTKTFDGIIYSPKAGEGSIAAEHWKFDAMPHAVLAIVDDRLDDVGSFVPRN